MLTRPLLMNIALFLERVQCQGKEALAWTETYQAVGAEIQAIDAATKAPVQPAVEGLESHG